MKSSNNKGRRSHNTKRPGKFDKEQDRYQKVDTKYNDSAWYVKSPQLAKDVASISFNRALGAPATLVSDNPNGALNIAPHDTEIPGVMSIYCVPAVSASSGPSSPINLASKNFYSYIRHANSGHSNYDSPDLMMYIMAMDSVYTYLAYLQRAYGVAHTYSQLNRFVGDALLSAMNIDPTSFRQNLAQFRAGLNMLIVKASAFVTPTNMPIFKRHMWMYSGIYKDEDNPKAQMYMYNPMSVWQYNETSGNPGFLEVFPICGDSSLNSSQYWPLHSARTVPQLLALGDSLLAPLVASEDLAIMSGDILKAFGENGVWRMALVPEDYTITPVYSEEVLDQIHNTNFAGFRPRTGLVPSSMTADLNGLRLTQNASANDPYLVFEPAFMYAYHLSMTRYVDMDDKEPSPERVLVATRNMLSGSSASSSSSTPTPSNTYTYLEGIGSDICLFAYIFRYNSSGLLTPTTAYFAVTDDSGKLLKTRFHRAPLTYYSDANGLIPAGYDLALTEVSGELNNFTIVNHDDIERMHESAILSLFDVPV